MTALRSLMFNMASLLFNAGLLIGLTVMLAFPRSWAQSTVRLWTQALGVVLKFIIGLEYEVRGLENLPEGCAVIVSKHQSAWDTFAFYLFLSDPNYILKKELMDIPFWGWCARKCGAISVDREGGASALKQMVRDTEDRLRQARQVIIFPEGTRSAPGSHHPYQPGISAIYSHIDAPVIPVAVNSGLFWGRRSFKKFPGVITVEFLPPMPKGLKRREFMADLETRIEGATDRLVAEARARFPYLANDF
ncbi:MAG: 1-acyl-sn-glycerol-3-phosphate acyltransferase [Rhodospirillales bacterium]|nr:1-acyl-sn-glycerol-3-phosphate acyltransferase [Rhodospirillales bacterium]